MYFQYILFRTSLRCWTTPARVNRRTSWLAIGETHSRRTQPFRPGKGRRSTLNTSRGNSRPHNGWPNSCSFERKEGAIVWPANLLFATLKFHMVEKRKEGATVWNFDVPLTERLLFMVPWHYRTLLYRTPTLPYKLLYRTPTLPYTYFTVRYFTGCYFTVQLLFRTATIPYGYFTVRLLYCIWLFLCARNLNFLQCSKVK